MKRTSLLLVSVFALVLAACGGSEETTESPSPSPTVAATLAATPQTSPTEDAGQTADATAAATGDAEATGALPTLGFDGDPELAGRFPETVGGQTLQVLSMRGDQFLGMGGETDDSLEEFLESVDADLADVSVAFGGVRDASLTITAVRVVGVDQERLEQEFLGSALDEGGYEGLSEESIAGKDVWTADDPSGQVGAIYFYVKDDTVYVMTGMREQAEELLEALP